MDANFLSCDHADDDYIDMEIGTFSNFFCHSKSSPQYPREFEFQMSSDSLEKEHTTSPADELFYKGKLLPLHLPPRLKMVEKILENSSSVYNCRNNDFEDFYSTPLMTIAATTPTTTSTPFESCNISPSESCRVSRELNLEEYCFEYSSEVSGFIGENPKKSWTKKLKLIKQSTLGSKLKASRSYFKSLFGKSGCSDDSCTAAAKVADEGTVSRAKECLSKYAKSVQKTPLGQTHNETDRMSTTATRNVSKQKMTEDGSNRLHRRSFSMAIKRHSTCKSSSSTSSSSSSDSSSSLSSALSHGLPFLMRSSSSKTEIENPIQGAIAHCKQSQQPFQPRKTVSEVGICSLMSASKIAICEEQDRPELCRG